MKKELLDPGAVVDEAHRVVIQHLDLAPRSCATPGTTAPSPVCSA